MESKIQDMKTRKDSRQAEYPASIPFLLLVFTHLAWWKSTTITIGPPRLGTRAIPMKSSSTTCANSESGRATDQWSPLARSLQVATLLCERQAVRARGGRLSVQERNRSYRILRAVTRLSTENEHYWTTAT